MLDLETLVEWTRLSAHVSLPQLQRNHRSTWRLYIEDGTEVRTYYGERMWAKTYHDRDSACQEALAKWSEKMRQGYTLCAAPELTWRRLVHTEDQFPIMMFPLYEGLNLVAWCTDDGTLEVRDLSDTRLTSTLNYAPILVALSHVLKEPGRVVVGTFVFPVLYVQDGTWKNAVPETPFPDRWRMVSSWLSGSLRPQPHVVANSQLERDLHRAVYKSSGIKAVLEQSMV